MCTNQALFVALSARITAYFDDRTRIYTACAQNPRAAYLRHMVPKTPQRPGTSYRFHCKHYYHRGERGPTWEQALWYYPRLSRFP